MNFILTNAFNPMLEQRDYESMRSGLRQAPMNNLRLTVRKYKEVLPDDVKREFTKKYTDMIDKLDFFDVLTFKRTQGASNDQALGKALEESKRTFNDMIAVIPAK